MPGFNSKKLFNKKKTAGFNIQFKIILGQFNSIKYSIQNHSWPIQFNKIYNFSLEFQEVLHDQNRLGLIVLTQGCLPVPKGIFVDGVGGQPNWVHFSQPKSPRGSFCGLGSPFHYVDSRTQKQLLFFDRRPLFIQKFRFIQCENLDIDSKTYSSNSFSTKKSIKKIFKTQLPKNIQLKNYSNFFSSEIFNSKSYSFSYF